MLSIKRCDSFFPLRGYRSLQFFHCVKFSSMVGLDSLLKGPPNSIVNSIKIGDVWGPYVRLDEMNLLFLQIICGITYCVCRCTILLKCPFVLATSCLDIRQQTHSQDESKMVRTIDLCARINEDHVCLTHAGHSDRNHNVSSEVLPFMNESAGGYVHFSGGSRGGGHVPPNLWQFFDVPSIA